LEHTKIPHDLVASFRSTLDEALEPSLLLQIVDAAEPVFRAQMQVTREVLVIANRDPRGSAARCRRTTKSAEPWDALGVSTSAPCHARTKAGGLLLTTSPGLRPLNLDGQIDPWKVSRAGVASIRSEWMVDDVHPRVTDARVIAHRDPRGSIARCRGTNDRRVGAATLRPTVAPRSW
jgi:hypothetical protein